MSSDISDRVHNPEVMGTEDWLLGQKLVAVATVATAATAATDGSPEPSDNTIVSVSLFDNSEDEDNYEEGVYEGNYQEDDADLTDEDDEASLESSQSQAVDPNPQPFQVQVITLHDLTAPTDPSPPLSTPPSTPLPSPIPSLSAATTEGTKSTGAIPKGTQTLKETDKTNNLLKTTIANMGFLTVPPQGPPGPPAGATGNSHPPGSQPRTVAFVKRKANCRFYMGGFCSHGLNGISCAYTHPQACSKWLQDGDKGCSAGKECHNAHPVLCPGTPTTNNSRICNKLNCKKWHKAKTRKPKPGAPPLSLTNGRPPGTTQPRPGTGPPPSFGPIQSQQGPGGSIGFVRNGYLQKWNSERNVPNQQQLHNQSRGWGSAMSSQDPRPQRPRLLPLMQHVQQPPHTQGPHDLPLDDERRTHGNRQSRSPQQGGFHEDQDLDVPGRPRPRATEDQKSSTIQFLLMQLEDAYAFNHRHSRM